MALTCNDQPIGIYALSADIALDAAEHCPRKICSLDQFHAWLISTHSVECKPIEEGLWQRVLTPEDRIAAEEKLDRWLVKPTDGVFARMNRRISVPISRQLIKLPITPNMVSLFTLGVGIASGAFFAWGGYWYTLVGAVLSVWASILDGCDGEVARLKLLESDFGCWLETVCDYLYYLVIFARDGDRIDTDFGREECILPGGSASLRSCYELPGHCDWAASSRAAHVPSSIWESGRRRRKAGDPIQFCISVDIQSSLSGAVSCRMLFCSLLFSTSRRLSSSWRRLARMWFG